MKALIGNIINNNSTNISTPIYGEKRKVYRMKKLMIMLFAMIMVICLFSIGPPYSAMEITENTPLSSGDYFEYEYNIDEMLQDQLDESEDYTSYEKIEISIKMTVTGSEIVDVGGVSYDCWIMKNEMVMKYKFIGENSDDHILFEMEWTSKDWAVKDTYQTAKSEETTTGSVTMSYSDEEETMTIVMGSETVEKTTYTKIADPEPMPQTVGLTWTSDETYVVNTTDKNRMKYDDEPFDDWDFDYEETTESIQTNYEILSEGSTVVPAGTFETLKVKSTESGEDEYSITYYNENSIPVKMEQYEEGVLIGIMSLKSYSLQNAKGRETGDDDTIDFIGIGVVSLSVIAIASLGILGRKRR